MYICKECQTKYKTRVDYCDCGNNTFDFIDDTPQKINKEPMSLEQKKQIVSVGFFIICLILSTIVWLIPIKHTQTTKTIQPKKTETIKNIPNIDKIWQDTPEVVEKKNEPLKVEPKKSIQKVAQPKQEPKKIQPPKQTKKTSTPQPPKTETPKVVEKLVEEATKPPVKIEVKPAYNPNSPEMIRYKTNLRATLFSKFAVGSIQGSGSCDIEFAVDKTGKLINRKFTRESDNKTLNDTVYYMLMSVPKFLPPPTSYNGETIRMNFTINNGSYEISIK